MRSHRDTKKLYLLYTRQFPVIINVTLLWNVSISINLGMPVDRVLRIHVYHGQTLLEHYILQNYLRGVEYMISAGAGIYDYHVMACTTAGHEAILMKLLHAGANPHAKSYAHTAIEGAMLYGSANIVKQLLVAGAKTPLVNARCLARNSRIDSKLKQKIISAFLKNNNKK